MKSFSAFEPRDPSLAKRLVMVLTAVAAVVTVATSVLGVASTASGSWAAGITVVGPVLVLVGAVTVWLLPEPPPWLWAAFPLGATVAIALTDLATRDATATAQIFFFFPVLYAGAQLRRGGALALTLTAAAAEVVVTFNALPVRVALVDSTYVIAAFLTAASLLVYSAERVDGLIARLQEQAAIDPLTGLVTRRVLDSAATSALQGAANNGGTALLLIDLDHFKRINDEHGHPAGDLVLQRVSAVLREVGRRTDVVSRMGGDEFAVLMPGCPLETAAVRALAIVHQIRRLEIDVSAVTIARDLVDLPSMITLTASVGIAHLPTHANELHALYQAADMSLYRSKRTGRDRVFDLDDQSGQSERLVRQNAS